MNLDTRARRAVQGIHRAVEVMEMSTSTKEPRKLERFDRYRDRKHRNQRIGAILVAASLTIAMIVVATRAFQGGGKTTPAQQKAKNGRILYGVFDQATESDHLFTINPDGTDVRDLSTATGAGAQWSPDGSRILVSGSETPRSPLRPATIDADGSGFTLLAATSDPHLNLGCTTWSPDGSRIACEGFNETGHTELGGLYTVRSSDGGDLARLTDFQAIPGDYSPDGTQIVLLGVDHQPYDQGALFVVNNDGTGLRRITPSSYADVPASWSPDGQWIVFVHVGGELYLVRPDGTGLQPVPLAGVKNPGTPAWSPDGTRIVFTGSVYGATESDLYSVRPDGTDVVQITHTPDVDEASLDWGTNEG